MEQEGTRLRLETRRSTVLEMEAENKIITGAVGSDGSFALVTKSTQGYLSEVCVYNKKGEKIYRRRFAARTRWWWRPPFPRTENIWRWRG